MKKPPIKGEVVGLRLTEDQLRRFTAAAEAQDLTCAAWLRDLADKATLPDPSLQTLAEEILALRVIIQNLILHILDNNLVTVDALRDICRRADAEKKTRVQGLFPFNINRSTEVPGNVQ